MNRLFRKRLASMVLWSSSALAVLLGTTTWACRKQSPRVTVLSPSSLRVDASAATVQNVIANVCRDIEKGPTTERSVPPAEPNATTRSGSPSEEANAWGAYSEGSCSCEDTQGSSIQFRWYWEPWIGTLITWECEPGFDDRPVSDAIRKALACHRE